MADEPQDPKRPPLDRSGTPQDGDDWESDLAAWDAALPILEAPISRRERISEGAVPSEENPFTETPITVISAAHPLLTEADVWSETETSSALVDPFSADPDAAFDGGGLAPASGSYALLVTNATDASSLFDRDPPVEEVPSFPSETLVEMTEGAWRDGLNSLVRVDVTGASGLLHAPDRGHWEVFSQLIRDERARAQEPEPIFDLCLAAARVAEALGQVDDSAAFIDEALSMPGLSSLSGLAPAAHRARLCLAEKTGRFDDEALESLHRLALFPHPDQTTYRGLWVEWTLAQSALGQADATAAAHIAAAPEGLARALAEAELAWSQPATAAAILETAAHRLSGGVGAALLNAAAALSESASDFQAAAEQRFMASRLLSPDVRVANNVPRSGILGLIRDAARLESDAAASAIEALLPQLPPSSLKVSLSRWGAHLAGRTSDFEREARLLYAPDDELGPTSYSLLRDRVDRLIHLPKGGDDQEGELPTTLPARIEAWFTALAARWSSPETRAALIWKMSAWLLLGDRDRFSKTVSFLRTLLEMDPDSDADAWSRQPGRWCALGAAFEFVSLSAPPISETTTQPELGLLLDWRRKVDPARQEATGSDSPEADPSPLSLWRASIRASIRCDFEGAASRLEALADSDEWKSSALAAPLRELAAERLARTQPIAATARMDAEGARDPEMGQPQRFTHARVLRLLGDSQRWTRARLEQPMDGLAWRMAAKAESLLLSEGQPPSVTDLRLASEILDEAPTHPVALAITLTASDAQARVAALGKRWAAQVGPYGFWATVSAVWAALGDSRDRASLDGATTALLGVLSDLDQVDIDARERPRLRAALSSTLRWIALGASPSASQRDDESRSRVLGILAIAGAQAPHIVEAAELQESNSNPAGAVHWFREALMASDASSVSAEIALGLFRCDAVPSFWTATGQPLTSAERATLDFDALARALRAEQWDDALTLMVDSPPHERDASAQTWSWVASLGETHRSVNVERVARDWERAEALVLRPESVSGETRRQGVALSALFRLADSQGDVSVPNVVRARVMLAELAAAEGDRDSAALFYWLAAGGERGDASVSLDSPSDVSRTRALTSVSVEAPERERLLRLAIGKPLDTAGDDPARTWAPPLPVLMTWRRHLARTGHVPESALAAAAEAESAIVPEHRAAAWLRAADLAATGLGDDDANTAGRDDGRTIAWLRRALEAVPSDGIAYSRLREIYERHGRHHEWMDLLEQRLRATTNPFESTALRLERANCFAGPLSDVARAKIELGIILQREPQHARALAQLTDLEESTGNFAAAVDLLVRRAAVERSAEKLRDIFLRLGRIHIGQVPDTRRAAAAFARVIQVEPKNREALEPLSRLYLELGDTKAGLSVLETLLALDATTEARTRHLLRQAQFLERANDVRGAQAAYRKASANSPTDVAALSELLRYLEKIRDAAGRRFVLDDRANRLRNDLNEAAADAAVATALAEVQRWRGRSASSAALGEWGRRATPESAAAVRGKSLSALKRSEIEETLFPPSVPPGFRLLFRQLGALLADGRKVDLARVGASRADRVVAGSAARAPWEAVANDLGVGTFELFVVGEANRDVSPGLHVFPGKSPSIVVGHALAQLMPRAGSSADGVSRFLAARTLFLVATGLDHALIGDVSDLADWLTAVVRPFLPDYAHPAANLGGDTNQMARVSRQLTKKLRQEIMPFVLETSGALDLPDVRMGILDAANRVGLLAAGTLVSSVRALCVLDGKGTGESAVLDCAQARRLLAFAGSDEYDEVLSLL